GLMASQNAGALLTGMTDGVVNMWKFGLQQQRYDREDERQAKRDAREDKESGIRTEEAQLTLDKARQERDTQRYLREVGQRYMSGEDVPDFDAWLTSQSATSKPVAPVASAASAAAPAVPSAELPPLKPTAMASTATSMPAPNKTDASVPNPFADTAPTVAPQAAPAPATAPATAQQADKPTPSIGDVIAAKGMKQQRTEDDVIKWLANFQRSQGLHDKASETETKWFELTEKRRAREKALLREHALKGIIQGGGEWVAQNMGHLFGPDVQLRHAPDGNGGGVITAYKASDPTKPIGTQRYKDEADLIDMTDRYIDPVDYAKRVAEAKAAEVKFKRDMQLRTASRGLVLDANGDPAYYIDKPSNGRGNGSGGGDGTGTRGGKEPKAPPTPTEAAMSILRDYATNGDDPSLRVRAAPIVNSAFALNPGARPEIVAAAALDAARNTDNVKPRIDFGNGSIVEAHVNPNDGTQTPLYRVSPDKDLKPYAEQFKGEVATFLEQQEANSQGMGTLLLQAATGNTSALQTLPAMITGKIQERLMQMGPDLSKSDTATRMNYLKAAQDRAKQLAAKEMQRIQRILPLIRQYGQ
ncbi:MAG: hypothetical protein ACMV1D_10575, partial [Macromonas sp.]